MRRFTKVFICLVLCTTLLSHKVCAYEYVSLVSVRAALTALELGDIEPTPEPIPEPEPNPEPPTPKPKPPKYYPSTQYNSPSPGWLFRKR